MPAFVALLRRLAPFALFYLVVSTLVRLSLAARVSGELGGPAIWAEAFALGLARDLAIGATAMLPVIVWWIILPRGWQGRGFDRLMTWLGFGLFAAALLVISVAEHLFWSEFTSRFNFIAVDYLVYTREVVGNIRESYPLGWAFGAVGTFALLVAIVARRWLKPVADGTPLRRRAVIGLAVLLAAGAAAFGVATRLHADMPNAYADEVGRNGPMGFITAFFGNEISYRRFYATIPDEAARARVQAMLATPDATLEADHGAITRDIRADGPEQRLNVVLVVMESMSAEFMGLRGNAEGLTTNLDRLGREGLWFSNMYATGTRTVRGLEAVTLSVPPTPGQSIVRRPGNGNLYSLGSVLQDRGYDTAFIYGGYGYFDNMNAFYAGNGFRIVDRASLEADEIRFANVWGVSDEDLFARVVREADAAHGRGQPFLHVVMTTSNHRPYTFPPGSVDLNRMSGRLAGVFYADKAIGSLIEAARMKPWFQDTLFVFVADHTANAAGRLGIELEKYRIPLIVYAPGHVAPRERTDLASQVDVAPTILGLLNIGYRSRFYGRDLMREDTGPAARAYVSTFEKVGLVREGNLAILEPNAMIDTRAVTGERVPRGAANAELVADAQSVYQFASDWRLHSGRIDSRLPGALSARP
jgi:phosphoglycerol transferase MdoB-like AlkP superfamily enzyme